MSIAERIYEQSKNLPEPAAREVLDFVEFIGKKVAPHDDRLTDKKTIFEDKGQWSAGILSFEGFPDIPRFEDERDDLALPGTDPLA